ncbi:HIT family protein [Pyrococcus horikoshii]|uniref:HIT domain-containing protein n=2 Tax=Pyrococcus horikoshii TaxID=53953 RepID=O58729_PYRHO|nr:HIT family protein [Pyrococcus horikoshii]BAA30098.1 150aa long hypothetical protein [Pyrococcus horikoshii OT3]HII61940.1 HIT family protein [Pyrococcus horikoshii]
MKCPFCNPIKENILYEDDTIRILLDNYPANPGHLLIVPRRHVTKLEELSEGEKASLLRGIEIAIEALKKTLNPDGFNVGINIGKAAGQTVEHLHIHVIPRFNNDCKYPKGGIRKAVLDVKDENLEDEERWTKNRLPREKVEELRRALHGG